MALWNAWFAAITLLRPAFARQATFMWFVLSVAGLSIRSDNLGVTSTVRALRLDRHRAYASLLRNFHSHGIDLTLLGTLWSKVIWRLFADRLERVNGRAVVIADGKNIAKSGKKMPGVKSLFQHSESNTKPAFIMGHCAQALSVLVKAGRSTLAVPLGVQIHDGTVFSNRDKRTLLDKLLIMIKGLGLPDPVYLVADAYYGNGKIINGMLATGSHLVSRAKRNVVAYEQPSAPADGKRGRGRPRIYGSKVELQSLFVERTAFSAITSPIYGEQNVTMQVRTVELLWKPAGRLVRFVLAEHPQRGRIMLMSSDLALEPVEIIRLYALRFKIEFGFKQAAHVVGSFDYHFWMAEMIPTRRAQKNTYLHRATEEYREAVRRKLHAFHVYLFAGVVAQGLMHYLAASHTDAVWRANSAWLRTLRKGIAPSELVVKLALRQALPEFLLGGNEKGSLAKFIVDRQAPDMPDDRAIAA